MRQPKDMEEDEQGKLFVGGLSWETTQESLQRYFSRYGEVIDCVVMKNNETGRSRGFGFVTFADPNNVTVVIQNCPHQLDGRTIDPKPCNPRTLQKPKKNSSFPKVFLGGLPSNVTETDLRTFFNRYGKVMEVVIMYDQEKKKSRGFGFLSFEDDEAVDRCCSEHFVNLSGKQVEIKKAEPRDSSNKNNDMGNNQWGPPQSGGPMAMGPNMGMGNPNGPMAGMTPMGPGNMMQGYQGWGSTPPTQAFPGQWAPSNQTPMNGYGNPSAPQGYTNWGAPPGPQAPPQWGSTYGAPPQQSGYGSYGHTSGGPQSGYGNNWNWNMPQNGPTTPATAGAPAGGATGAAPAGPNPTGPSAGKPPADYSGYGTYAQYQQESSNYSGRNYAGANTGAPGTDQYASAAGWD
uniref:Heterogeneous nuclear ribonucleoprotein 27C n=1 Tax=Cacopsylla melanoneura TaxID=428564 RepID=A0A8D8TAQ7_9HEMI